MRQRPISITGSHLNGTAAASEAEPGPTETGSGGAQPDAMTADINQDGREP